MMMTTLREAVNQPIRHSHVPPQHPLLTVSLWKTIPSTMLLYHQLHLPRYISVIYLHCIIYYTVEILYKIWSTPLYIETDRLSSQVCLLYLYWCIEVSYSSCLIINVLLQSQKQTQSQKALSKVDKRGMKSLSSFFGKKKT